MTSPCRQEQLLSAYLDGELPDAQADELKMHLAECPDCRRALEAFGRSDTLIRDLPSLEPSAQFDRTFWEKIETLESGSRYRLWAVYLFRGWRPLWVGAIATLAVAVMIYFGGRSPLSPEEVFIAEHMEFLKDYDVIGQLELLEHLDAIDAINEPS